MNDKTKKRMKYALCAVLTAAVTAAAMFMPQVYYSVSDGKNDPGSVNETFDTGADDTGFTTEEFVALAGSADTVWVRNYSESSMNYGLLAQGMQALADSLKENSDSHVTVEYSAALISDMAEYLSGCDSNDSSRAIYAENYRGYTMKGTFEGKSVENDFIYASFALPRDDIGCTDSIRILYDKNNNMIYEFLGDRTITDAETNAKYVERYDISSLPDDTEAYNAERTAAQKYWQLESDDVITDIIGYSTETDGSKIDCVSVYLCVGQSFEIYCPDNLSYDSETEQ